MSGIGRFIIFSIIATAVLWGVMYGIEWFSDRYKPHMSGTADNASETIAGDYDPDTGKAHMSGTADNASETGEGGGIQEWPVALDPVFYTAEEESRANLEYINGIRAERGRPQIAFDARAYDLALARVHDTLEYNYRDHVNPYTGTCPYTMKGEYGFATHEQVAENLAWIDGVGLMGPNEATDLWMDSKGHRFNLLYPSHTGGATACDGGVCIFLGVNNDLFGAECATAAEGEAYWSGRPGE